MLALIVAVETVQFGSAAPAKHYKVSECHNSQGIEICFTDQGTVQENEVSAGHVIYAINSRESYTIAREGIVFEESASNYHFNGVWMGDEPKVFHSTTRSWAVVDGNACSYDSTFLYTNGEVRRDITNLVCN
jgi:hypothetical protein